MFEKIYGHQRIKTIMENMISNDQLPHGLCFHGPKGIGKRFLAQEIARATLCETRTSCGTCSHCHKMKSGNHPDFVLVEPDGQDIKVDQIRNISENLHFRPYEGRARIIVLDQAERMAEAAANAFLKSLEEPPEYVYFILVTSDVKSLLPTIRSRCQQHAFSSLSRADKVRILVDHFHKDEATATRLAAISYRSLETEAGAWEVFSNDVKRILGFFQQMFKSGQALDYFSDMTRDKTSFPRLKEYMVAVLRELMRRAYGLPAEAPFGDWDAEMATMSQQAKPAEWREMIEKMLWLEGNRRRNLNQNLWFNGLSVNDLGLYERSADTVRKRLSSARS